MADILKVTIITPERKLVDGLPVTAVTLPTAEGEIEVLPGHAALMGRLDPGYFRYTTSTGKEEVGFISTGFFEVHGETLKVLAENLELKDEINVSRAKQAQLKAEAALSAADLDPAHFNKYQLKLQRAIIRQHIGS
ncbi:MAG: ATP synthase F1 subunit epsilon [Bdellovibrionales bacterium]|nr:ATP synthase F1 subunit epsilon [Bdellovibrionales bacterium]